MIEPMTDRELWLSIVAAVGWFLAIGWRLACYETDRLLKQACERESDYREMVYKLRQRV